MMSISRLLRSGALTLLLTPLAADAVVIQFVGGDPIASPVLSTDFGGLPLTANLSSPQTFDGFTFEQINADPHDWSYYNPGSIWSGDPHGIWTYYNPGGSSLGGFGWYPNGGDVGYTQITLSGGGDFGDVGLYVGSGNFYHSVLAYELLDGAAVVAAGTLAGHQQPYHWLAILGGGFDTIRLRDGTGGVVGDNTLNALAFDQVRVGELPVPAPEPPVVFLLALALAATWLRTRFA